MSDVCTYCTVKPEDDKYINTKCLRCKFAYFPGSEAFERKENLFTPKPDTPPELAKYLPIDEPRIKPATALEISMSDDDFGLLEQEMASVLYDLGLHNVMIFKFNLPHINEALKRGWMTGKVNDITGKHNLILSEARINDKEFPIDEYTINPIWEPNKKPIPVKEVLDRESQTLEACGFININDYIQFHFQRAYIYPNEIGRKVLETLALIVRYN